MADSMETLKQLRDASIRRQQTAVNRQEVLRQIETITKLQTEKDTLSQKLDSLLGGSYPDRANEEDSLELVEMHQVVATMKEKIAAHKMLGPCGLSVLEVNPKMMVISFTATWKNLTQSFFLKISMIEGAIKVIGTDIPYFVDAINLLCDCPINKLSDKLDIIGNRLRVFVHKKREFLYIEDEFKDVLKSARHDEPICYIELNLEIPFTNKKLISLQLYFVNIEELLPENVEIVLDPEAADVVGEERKAELCQLFHQRPLSVAFQAMVESLRTPHASS